MLEITLYGIGIIGGSILYNILKGESTTAPKTNDNNIKDYRRETENYCSQLSIDELHDYIDSNYVLSEINNKHHIYSTCNKYDKSLIVKHIGDIAVKENKSFNNRFSVH